MSKMELLSVNVGQPKEVSYTDRRGRKMKTLTGIFKIPVAGRLQLQTLNLDGDGQADLEAHGGIHKAVYVYGVENSRYWADVLGRTDFAVAGQLGENFTVAGMTDDLICVGDIFRIGDAIVEVTQPRVPCFKLGILMGIPDFHKRFAEACRTGFYLRVVEPGEVGAGDEFERIGQADNRMTIRDMMHLLYFDPDNIEGARKALGIEALSPGWRQSFVERLDSA